MIKINQGASYSACILLFFKPQMNQGSSGVFYNIYIQEIQVKVVAMFMWWTGSLAEIRGGKWAAHKPQHVTWYEKRTTWWQVTAAFCPRTWNSFTTFTANTSTPQTRRTWNHTFAFGRQQQTCWVYAVFMWQAKKKKERDWTCHTNGAFLLQWITQSFAR